MPTYVEAIKFENAAPPRTIRLIKSGEFWRAYNHSAWLFSCCIVAHKVLRKYVKALKDDVYYVGFPVSSLFQTIGDHQSVKTELGFDVALTEEEMPDEAGFETWKATVNTEPSSAGDFHSLPLAGADAEREVIRRLREFPLENRTMVDCAVFVAQLRALLSNK